MGRRKKEESIERERDGQGKRRGGARAGGK